MICFEITETSAIADLPSARRFIQALKKLGCRFSLDDFGTGMSSFWYLKHLPVDFIKIDGSFITEMLNSKIDRAMVEMIVYIAKVTGKRTVAEFVESEEIIEALREIGVDYAQGYAIGKPAPFESMYPLLAGARREVA
jgi:EAL domain-containing protein (putative c-di-GMP-specific phosphodiesterase class I)